ncbi:uncharacterized protein LOC108226663 isoform X2 [Daucus carota subsp. sativus]|uniref:uncharacterized protein LOC108226663 isoform X2 n=1 Tax=Daucus carota subsp. sativus TaxID=79200 RepID=UPI0007EF3C81|nr:PREDICTED: uncharacterized protein LOC108226663 isoform X2 [Daucus carota subsp. sativus]
MSSCQKYMPLLTMMQEIHFKLMTRMRQKRDEMLKTDYLICPRIKKRLDLLITESRNWTASWDGQKLFAVKQGTRVNTVDLETMSCSCRVFDLTGIPCEHAIAAIYDRRHQVIDYISDYYKRSKYLASYQHSLEAIKGEEFWEVHSTDELLPPDIPKKLRGRPKRLRRREDWEGGNRIQSSQVKTTGPILQRFSNRRKMHCSLCKSPDHRKSNCPTKSQLQDNDQGTQTQPPGNKKTRTRTENEVPVVTQTAQEPVVTQDENHVVAQRKKTPKEAKRQKIQVRRAVKNVDKQKLPFVKNNDPTGGD